MPEQGPARRFVVRGGARRTPFRGVCPHYSGSCAGMQGGGAAAARIHKLLNSDSYMGRSAAGQAAPPVRRQAPAPGTSPADIPVKVFEDDLSTYINETTAAAIGVTVPDEILNGENVVLMQ